MKAKQQAALAAVVLAVVFMCAFGFLVLFARPASPALRSAGTQPEVEQAEDAQEDPQLIQTSAIRQVVAQELAPVMKLLDKQKEDILASVQTAKDSSAASIMAAQDASLRAFTRLQALEQKIHHVTAKLNALQMSDSKRKQFRFPLMGLGGESASTAKLSQSEAGTPNAPATSGDDTVSALMANVVLDDLNDLSHNEMLSNANDFMIDESNVEFFHGDQRRLTRTVIRHDLQQWVAWRLSDMAVFEAWTYHWPSEVVHDFKFFASSDNVKYQKLTPTVRKVQRSDKGFHWIEIAYSIATPPGTEFVKAVFPQESQQSWNPQLGRVRMSNFLDVTVQEEPPAPTYNVMAFLGLAVVLAALAALQIRGSAKAHSVLSRVLPCFPRREHDGGAVPAAKSRAA